jgi:hypothetical protein
MRPFQFPELNSNLQGDNKSKEKDAPDEFKLKEFLVLSGYPHL